MSVSAAQPNPPVLGKRFETALVDAFRLHQTQTRKGGDIPYFSHLLITTGMVLENGGTENQGIATLFHDGPEDQGGQKTLDAIRQKYGDEVADIVAGCTDTMTTPKPPYRQRKEAYINSLAAKPESVLLVSSADKLHNARAVLNDYRQIGEALWQRFNGGRDGTLWYYRAILDAYQQRGYQTPITGELNRVVTELETLANRPRLDQNA